jgi:4-hydroxy-3-methylbut-2-enyl diphosphate reductase IspH
MAKYKVKVNPIYPADAIGDEILGVTFTKNEWTEVNGTDWKRLQESKGRLWDEFSIPRLIAEDEDWEVVPVSQTTSLVDNTKEVSDEVAEEEISDDWYKSEEE